MRVGRALSRRTAFGCRTPARKAKSTDDLIPEGRLNVRFATSSCNLLAERPARRGANAETSKSWGCRPRYRRTSSARGGRVRRRAAPTAERFRQLPDGALTPCRIWRCALRICLFRARMPRIYVRHLRQPTSPRRPLRGGTLDLMEYVMNSLRFLKTVRVLNPTTVRERQPLAATHARPDRRPRRLASRHLRLSLAAIGAAAPWACGK